MPTDVLPNRSAFRNLGRTGRATIDLVNEFLGAPLFTCVLLLDRCTELLAEDALIAQARKGATGEEEAQVEWLPSDGSFVDDFEHLRIAHQLEHFKEVKTGARRQALHFFALVQRCLLAGAKATSLQPDDVQLPKIVALPVCPWKHVPPSRTFAVVTKPREVAVFGKFDTAPFPLLGVIPGEADVPEEPAEDKDDLKGRRWGQRFAWFQQRCEARQAFALAQWSYIEQALQANGPAEDQAQRELDATLYQEGVSPEVLRSRLWVDGERTALNTTVDGPVAWKEVPLRLVADDVALPEQEELIKSRDENFWKASRLEKRIKARRVEEAFVNAAKESTTEPPDRETARKLQRERWQALNDQDIAACAKMEIPKVDFLEKGKWEATQWGEGRGTCMENSQARMEKLLAQWKARRENPGPRDDIIERRRNRQRGVPVEAISTREHLQEAVRRGDLAYVQRLSRCTVKPRLKGCEYCEDESDDDEEETPLVPWHLVLEASTITSGAWPALRSYPKEDEGAAATSQAPSAEGEGIEPVVKSSELTVMLMTGAEITVKVDGRELPHEVRGLVGRALNLPSLAEKAIRFANDEGELWMHGTLAEACKVELVGAPGQEEVHSFSLTGISVQRGSWTAVKMVEALLKRVELKANELALCRQEAAAVGNYALCELFLDLDNHMKKTQDWSTLLEEASPLFDGSDELLLQELLLRGYMPGSGWLSDKLAKISASVGNNTTRKLSKGLDRLAGISLAASICSPATSKVALESLLQACGSSMWAFLQHHWSSLLEDEEFMLKQLVRSRAKGEQGLQWVSSNLLSSKHFAVRTPLGKDARSFPNLHKSLQTDEEVVWVVIEATPQAAWQVPVEVFTVPFALRLVEKQRKAVGAIPKATVESPEFLSGLEDLMNRLDTELANTSLDPSSEREHCLRLCQVVLEVATIFSQRPMLQEVRRKDGAEAKESAVAALAEEEERCEKLAQEIEALEEDVAQAGADAAQQRYVQACIELKMNNFLNLSNDLKRLEDVKTPSSGVHAWDDHDASAMTDILRLIRWLLEGKVTRSLQYEVSAGDSRLRFDWEATNEADFAELLASQKHWASEGAEKFWEKLADVRLAEVSDDVVKAIQRLAPHVDLGADEVFTQYPRAWSTRHLLVGDLRGRNNRLNEMALFTWAQKVIYAFVMLAVNVQPAQQYLEASKEELEKSRERVAALKQEVERCSSAAEEEASNEAGSFVPVPQIAEHLMEVCTKEIDLLKQDAVALEEAVAKAKAEDEAAASFATPLKERAEELLAMVVPTVEKGRHSLDCLSLKDLAELRAMRKPPRPMLPVMKAALQLASVELAIPPKKAQKGAGSPDKEYEEWMRIQRTLSNYRILDSMKRALDNFAELPPKLASEVQEMVDALSEDDIKRIPNVSFALNMFWEFTTGLLKAAAKYKDVAPEVQQARDAMKKCGEAAEEHDKHIKARDDNLKRQEARSALISEAHEHLLGKDSSSSSRLAQGSPSSWLPRAASPKE